MNFHNINVNPSHAQLNDAMCHEHRFRRINQDEAELRAIGRMYRTCGRLEKIVGTLDIHGECWACWKQRMDAKKKKEQAWR